MSDTEVRTRFAPSPTGMLHIGGVRTALFSWLAAKREAGTFFIRLEDTDQNRYVDGSARQILETFDWLGIALDGGPDHAQLQAMKSNEDYAGALSDGSYKGIPGPFVQSQRLGIYKQHAEWLIEHGHAYRANETPEELERMRTDFETRKQTFRFTDELRIRKDVRPDEPHVVRMKMPRTGQTRFHDLIKGDMVFENANLDDQVLLKADGFGTYHLAAMVDDHLMGVTHVIRADEWLPSAPKHIQLYQMFGWHMPHFAHVPNVLGSDGKKLSKRHGATSIFELRDQGYIPEAVINFLAMLGWAPGKGDEQNIFSLEELFQKFSLDQVGSSPAVFEYTKLNWTNREHIRKLQPDDLAKRLIPFLAKDGLHIDTDEKYALLLRLLPLIQTERMEKLTDAHQYIDFFFADVPTPPVEMLIGQKMEQHFSAAALRTVRDALAQLPNFDNDALTEQTLNDVCDELKLKRGQLFGIVRNALSGKTITPPLFGMMRIIGREVVMTRIDKAIAQLQGG